MIDLKPFECKSITNIEGSALFSYLTEKELKKRYIVKSYKAKKRNSIYWCNYKEFKELVGIWFLLSKSISG